MKRTLLRGIHHVTAICCNANATIDFYTKVLGLRLVKLTVNFDDPYTYHIYFGDNIGSPGTLITFFHWPQLPKGSVGNGQPGRIQLAIPKGTINYWAAKLSSYSIRTDLSAVDQKAILRFSDPEGIPLELIEVESNAKEKSVIRIAGIELLSMQPEKTKTLLSNTMRFASNNQVPGYFWIEDTNVQLKSADVLGAQGTGTIHHVAWRVASNEDQLAWRDIIASAGLRVTPIIDRRYFRSIYFREPGGILFEIATDEPGFLIDEDEQRLGSSLRLPKWLEPYRYSIQAHLPQLEVVK